MPSARWASGESSPSSKSSELSEVEKRCSRKTGPAQLATVESRVDHVRVNLHLSKEAYTLLCSSGLRTVILSNESLLKRRLDVYVALQEICEMAYHEEKKVKSEVVRDFLSVR